MFIDAVGSSITQTFQRQAPYANEQLQLHGLLTTCLKTAATYNANTYQSIPIVQLLQAAAAVLAAAVSALQPNGVSSGGDGDSSSSGVNGSSSGAGSGSGSSNSGGGSDVSDALRSLSTLMLVRALLASGQLLQLAEGTAAARFHPTTSEPGAVPAAASGPMFRPARVWLQTYAAAVTCLMQQLQPGDNAAASQAATRSTASNDSSSSSSSSSSLLSMLNKLGRPSGSIVAQCSQLQESIAGLLADGTAAAAEPAASTSSSSMSLGQQLVAFGEALLPLLPSVHCCNHAGCTNLARLSEAELVGGKACVCARWVQQRRLPDTAAAADRLDTCSKCIGTGRRMQAHKADNVCARPCMCVTCVHVDLALPASN
jgi:hypothetical protein